jgi:hypothetical protein
VGAQVLKETDPSPAAPAASALVEEAATDQAVQREHSASLTSRLSGVNRGLVRVPRLLKN